MASWLVCSPPDRALAGDILLCSRARTLTFTMHLSTQVYKWVPANVILGGGPCDGLASHPEGSRNTVSRFMLRKPG